MRDTKIPTDEEIAASFKPCNFGTKDREQLKKMLQCSVLKRLAGYHCGSTMNGIQIALGLVTEKGNVTMFIYDAYFEQRYS